MYSTLKKIAYIVLISLAFTNICKAQSFTFTGPTNTTVTIPYGQNQYNATYYFNYSNTSQLYYPCLIVALDDNVISADLCHNPSIPSSFTIPFTSGSHTVQFSLLSIDDGYMNCNYPLIWHVENFNINTNFKIRIENGPIGGVVNVDNSNRTSPYDRTATPGSNFSFGAVDQIINDYNYIWNTNGNNLSKWQTYYFGSPTLSDFSNNRVINYNIQTGNNNLTFRYLI